ncbi:MAG: Na+/H+ antiporter subunit E [Devosia sp.]
MNPLRRLGRWVLLILDFGRELAVSATRVAFLSVQPNIHLRPAFIAYPLTVPSDAEITLLANMITLTPGTLSVEISDDRKWLAIHCIDAPDAQSIINAIAGGFERRVLGVFQ